MQVLNQPRGKEVVALQCGAGAFAALIDGVIAAPHDAVVVRQAVIVELVATVADTLTTLNPKKAAAAKHFSKTTKLPSLNKSSSPLPTPTAPP